MKKIKYISLFSLAFLAGVLFFSCKKTHDMPPINPGNGKLTIAQIRALYNGSNIKFTQDISLYATVTMTDNYKTLYLRDNTGSIMLKQLNAHSIYEGDSLRINLNGSTLDLSGVLSSLQIDSVDVSSTPTNKVTKLGYGTSHPPVPLTIAKANASASNVTLNGTTIPLSQYDGELVELSGVQFDPANSGFYIPLNTTQVYITGLTLYDCGNLNSMTFSLYSGTADFIQKSIPNGKSGSVIGALTFYNGSLQFTPRSYADVTLTQPRCGVDTLTQSFASAISSISSTSSFAAAFTGWGNYVTYGGGGTNHVMWMGPYTISSPPGYMTASNYNGGNQNARDEFWLITPPIQNNNPNKKISFDMSMAFQTAANARQLTVMISKDFQLDPASGTQHTPNLGGPNYVTTLPNATWVDISSSFTLNTTSNFVNTGTATISNSAAQSLLNGYNGSYYIAFRYRASSLTDSSQTVNIKNVSIKN